MKKIRVNKEICIGCGACIAIDETHFTFDDEGRSEVISQENLEDANLQNAIESCPVDAISIKEESDCECQKNTTIENNCDSDCECSNCTCDNCK